MSVTVTRKPEPRWVGLTQATMVSRDRLDREHRQVCTEVGCSEDSKDLESKDKCDRVTWTLRNGEALSRWEPPVGLGEARLSQRPSGQALSLDRTPDSAPNKHIVHEHSVITDNTNSTNNTGDDDIVIIMNCIMTSVMMIKFNKFGLGTGFFPSTWSGFLTSLTRITK